MFLLIIHYQSQISVSRALKLVISGILDTNKNKANLDVERKF